MFAWILYIYVGIATVAMINLLWSINKLKKQRKFFQDAVEIIMESRRTSPNHKVITESPSREGLNPSTLMPNKATECATGQCVES